MTVIVAVVVTVTMSRDSGDDRQVVAACGG